MTRRFAAPLSPLIVTIVVLAMAAFVTILPASAQENTDGRVTGIVTNGTTEQPMSGVEVTLSRFEQVGPESVDVTTTTDEAGRFEFSGLDASDGFVYAASTRHARVLYSSGMIRLSQSPEQDVEIVVYEPTADDSTLAVIARGIIVSDFDRENGIITVTDLTVLENTSKRTYTGDEDGRTVRFHVPGNAIQVTPRPGFDFTNAMIEDATVFTTAPVRPGTVNATMDYTVPYTGASARLPVQSSYPVESLRVLMPVTPELESVTLTARGAEVSDAGIVELDGRDYRVWDAGAAQAGPTVEFTLNGVPSTAIVHNELEPLVPGLVALATVALAATVTGVVVARRGLHRPRPVALAPAAAAPLDQRRDELARDLRALEDRWEEGSVDVADYRAQRRAILEDLRRISRQYRGLGDDEA